MTFGFWGDAAEVSAYEAIVAAFEEQNPGIDVRIEHVPNATDFARLATARPGWLPMSSSSITAAMGSSPLVALTPVGPLLASSEVIAEEDYFPEPLEAFRFGGELMCLPQNLSSLVVYYNRDLFDAAGACLSGSGLDLGRVPGCRQSADEGYRRRRSPDQHGWGWRTASSASPRSSGKWRRAGR